MGIAVHFMYLINQYTSDLTCFCFGFLPLANCVNASDWGCEIRRWYLEAFAESYLLTRLGVCYWTLAETGTVHYFIAHALQSGVC
jgi:hypothetical protein